MKPSEVRSWLASLLIRVPIALALSALPVAAQTRPGTDPTSATQNPTAQFISPRSASAASVSLLDEAVARLAHEPSISANVRQRIDMYGRKLIGSGNYRQLRTRTDLLFRFELKVPVGDTLASLLQVSDGRYLWTYRVLPDKQIEKGLDASLSTVDLNRVRELLFDPRRSATEIGMGGLPGLLEHTARMFEFGSAQQRGLHGMPVWVLTGKIRPSIVSQLAKRVQPDVAKEGEQQVSTDRLSHIPDFVTLALGADDLFPYQIEFRKKRPRGGNHATMLVETGSSRPMMTLEFFEVQTNVPVDPELFAFRPPNFQIDDSTDEFLANQRMLGRTDSAVEVQNPKFETPNTGQFP